MAGLAAEWDAVEEVRARVRDGGFLEDTSCGADPSNRAAVLNAAVVLPMLVRLASTPNQKLPAVDSLRIECKTFYDLNSREVSEGPGG